MQMKHHWERIRKAYDNWPDRIESFAERLKLTTEDTVRQLLQHGLINTVDLISLQEEYEMGRHEAIDRFSHALGVETIGDTKVPDIQDILDDVENGADVDISALFEA